MRIYSFLKLLFFLVLGVGLIGGGAYRVIAFPRSPSGEEVRIDIPTGTSGRDILTKLADEKIVGSPWILRGYLFLTGKADEIQAGALVLHRGSSVRAVADAITNGDAARASTVRVTLIEGWSARQMQEELKHAGLNVEDFLAVVQNQDVGGDIFSEIFQGKPKKSSLEGYLFPNTYEFYRTNDSSEIVDRLIREFLGNMTEERLAAAQNSGLSFFEVVTLASIIEKEVPLPQDRRIVAGIFFHRLRDDYPLESDATINYITGKKTTRPTLEDLAVASEYNTYQRKGLPAGPIGNPSLDAIDAVLFPTPSDYYFFLTTPNGDVEYSTTFDEHRSRKAKYYS